MKEQEPQLPRLSPTPIETTLARIETKVDVILQRLEWAPESMAGWYAELYPKYSHPNLEKQDEK